jgi:hypothetical protein
MNGAFQSNHPGGALFLFGGQNVSMLDENIDHITVYRTLASRAGDDVVAGSY